MLTTAVVQCAFSDDAHENNQKIIAYLEQAHAQGAQLVVLPELFLQHYFCQVQDEKFFAQAFEANLQNPYLAAMTHACKKLKLVAPFSFFEKSGPNYFNSVAMIDATGDILGIYRKSHIPDGAGYNEKFYFRPGNSGFKVFSTAYAHVGVGICWDQWFPECARILTLMGAQILLYPTAIGTEPQAPDLCTKKPWQRVMQGHAVANMIPIAAANRVGVEGAQGFYGSSFVCDEFGEHLTLMDDEEGVRVVQVDLNKASRARAAFGFFRDRRTELYNMLFE